MTRREKIMAVGVAGTVGALGLVMLARWAVVEPFRTVRAQITEESKRAQRLRANLEKLDVVADKWRGLTGRTFSEDPKEAQQLFREDVQQLLVERHGLKNAKLSPGTFVKYKDGSTGVPLRIDATGTLNQITGFLCDFYRRDYLARLDKVRITADQAVISNVNAPPRGGARSTPRTRGKGERTEPAPPAPAGLEIGPDGPELKLNVSAVTLVLPKFKSLEHPVLGREVTDLEHGRLLRDLSEYNVVFQHNLFAPYRERPPVVATPTPTTQPKVEEHRPAPPPPPTRVGADQKVVICTTTLNGRPLTYVLDKAGGAAPVSKFYLDEAIDDGTLRLILPRGLVVGVPQPAGGEQDYFYPLGKSFADREGVTAESHPEVVEALARAFEP
jgi:hypothetical protein